MTAGADDRIDRLYDLPLSEFTSERNALGAELRASGDHEAAASVKALRKPSAAAWAVNQLVRAEPDLVEALLGAGGELRQAHRQAASGRGAAQLRSAAAAERAVVDQLMTRARAVLGREPTAALAQTMRNTLHAASSDDEARERVASGTVVEELRPVGLGPAPAAARAAPTAADKRREAREAKAASAARAALRRELQAAERALDRAQESYSRARETADAAAERLKDARARVREARARLEHES